MKYRVLSGASAKSLEEQVIDLMSEGYVPIGGATVVQAGSRMIESALRGGGMINQVELLFSQAMILRYDPEDPANHNVKPPRPEPNCTIRGHHHTVANCPDRRK